MPNFKSLSQLEVCQEPSFPNGGNCRTMMVPETIFEGQGHRWCHGLPCLTSRKIPWKFYVDIFIRSVSRREVLLGGTWKTKGSWLDTWRTGSSVMSSMILFYPKEDALKVSCSYLYWKCVKNGGPLWGYLEDVEGSWPETWRTGSSLISWMTLFDPKEDTVKVSCWYLH